MIMPIPQPSTETAATQERAERVLRAVRHQAENDHGWTVASDSTPLDDLLRKESPALDDDRLTITEALHRLLEWCFGDGAHPAAVMRRFYALAKSQSIDLLAIMSEEQIASLFGETKQAFSFRFLALLASPASRRRSALKLPWQKTASAQATYSAKQKEMQAANGAHRSKQARATEDRKNFRRSNEPLPAREGSCETAR